LVLTSITSITGKKSMLACVLVFVRAPEKGKVKTRLAKTIGDEKTLDLYKKFVTQELDMLKRGRFAIIIFYHPAESKEVVQKWLGSEYEYIGQVGDDLGHRMAAAFNEAFRRGFKKALLIGSDLPDLPYAFVKKAFEALDGNDAVIGPSADGGYYLIGFHSSASLGEVFSGICWGGDDVFEKTLLLLRKNSMRYLILPEWSDVDDYGDLVSYIVRNKLKQTERI
jgi:rSAM/selenodomain-associated transferase 1